MRESWYFFSPPLLGTMCDVFEILKQREFGWTCFIDGRDLKQLRTLLGLQWKVSVWRQFCFFFSPALLGILKFPCQLLLVRSLQGCLCLLSHIWLVYDVQRVFLLANGWSD